MAEKENQDQENEASDNEVQKSESNKKKVIIIALLLLVIVGVALYFLLGASDSKKDQPSDHKESSQSSEKDNEKLGTADEEVFYDLKNFVVNLYSQDNRQRFLKITLTLHLKNNHHLDVITKKIPIIRDNFQFYLRELRVSDLSGSQRMMILKEELLLRVNKILNPVMIEDILFKEILIN